MLAPPRGKSEETPPAQAASSARDIAQIDLALSAIGI